MPEYLAPAVFVEETSYRAKSIEGVGTSTTGFAGLTATGPFAGSPPLLTSFADFQRIYGGLEDLVFKDPQGSKPINYLAHAVRAYFDEGGGRLYVARVEPTPAAVAEAAIPGLGSSRFVARFPGSGGNRSVRVRESLAEAPVGAMRRAPLGSFARVDVGGSQALPAKVQGGPGPTFAVWDGADLKLAVTVGGAASTVTVVFKGRNAEVFGATALAAGATVTIGANDDTLLVKVNGAAQTIKLAHGAGLSREAVVSDINRKLRGGYARLSDVADKAVPETDGDEGRLVLGTDAAGHAAKLEVLASSALALLGLTAKSTSGAFDLATNNVGDLAAVGVADLAAIFAAAGSGLEAALEPAGLTIRTAPGDNQIKVLKDGGANAALGFDALQDTVGVGSAASPSAHYYRKTGDQAWTAESVGAPALDAAVDLPAAEADQGKAVKQGAHLITLTVLVAGNDGRDVVHEQLGLHTSHPRSIDKVLSGEPTSLAERLTRAVALELDGAPTAAAVYAALVTTSALGDGGREFVLTGGDDGDAPGPEGYRAALERLSGVEDIAIVAAPGSAAYPSGAATLREIVKHVEKRRSYRIAVLDTPEGQEVGEARSLRSEFDSKYAALYYPWVVVPNPNAKAGDEGVRKEIALPPSGFVCGIYARNDIERGVHKAPANEVVRSALRFERDVNFGEQEVLNPLGVNCLRFFPGRGFRLWGARTASSDQEWKYVNVRRYFNYLERSIDTGMQWAVFEPNGERLWDNVRETIGSFLYNEWRSGRLLGGDPKQAYFVRCDRTVMTQDDLDNGRLICLVGVAVIKPAEFVIFRIGQKTADART